MTRFDRTRGGQIRSEIRDATSDAEIGRIKNVHERTEEDPDDKYNFEVDVEILGKGKVYRAIPFEFTGNGEITVPTKNDKVIVEFLDGQTKRPVARNTVYTNEDRAPKGRSGVWRRKIPSVDDDLYAESYTQWSENPKENDPKGLDNRDENGDPQPLDAEEAYVRLSKKSSDQQETPNASIELFDSSTEDSTIEVQIDDSWGLKLNLDTGEFKLLDQGGYGIVSDGSGNFTWHHQTVDFSEDTTTTL